MKHSDPLRDLDAPEWFRSELAKGEAPSKRILDKLQPLRERFLQALTPGEQPQGAADAVLDLLGRLKGAAEEIADLLFPPPDLSPAFAATRGAARSKDAKPEEQPIAKVAKTVGSVRAEVATYPWVNPSGEKSTQIEVNAFDIERGAEARPMTVEVLDEQGEALVPLTRIEPSQQAPRLPGPSSGLYCFRISCEAGRMELRLQIVEA